jgi:hypothetical protein
MRTLKLSDMPGDICVIYRLALEILSKNDIDYANSFSDAFMNASKEADILYPLDFSNFSRIEEKNKKYES